MKRLAVLACALALTLPVHADEKVGVGETAPGYAFEHPEVFTAQLLWGVAHGARLLALACAEHGKGAAAEAWVDWQEREQPQILAAGRVLGRHYFGVEDVAPDAVAAALGLKPSLALPSEMLDPACATLREALAQPRYDLIRFREKTLEALRRGPGPDPVEVLK